MTDEEIAALARGLALIGLTGPEVETALREHLQ